MKIVIAPDKFKHTLTAPAFCLIAEKTIHKLIPDAEILFSPLADGGEGTLDIVQFHLGGNRIKVEVSDPLFRKIKAEYLLNDMGKTAWIEMAGASGLNLLKPNERNPLFTTTSGTGELIRHALEKGVKKIIIGIGGSATNDLGTGMAAALGYRFFDKNGRLFIPTGQSLVKIDQIDMSHLHPDLISADFTVLCDVSNPLYGPEGAAFVYAPQKGASPEDVQILNSGLMYAAQKIRSQTGIDLQKIPGSGAAGGFGGGAVVFLNATLKPGIKTIVELTKLEEKIRNADLVITGEGKLDAQTLSGKVIAGVLKTAKKTGKPVAAFCGQIDLDEKEIRNAGLFYAKAISAHEPNTELAFKNTAKNLSTAIAEFIRKFKL